MNRAGVTIVGAGLAGSECAWQLARRGHRVRLFEMRPKVATAAHQTDMCAELVCSNSFRSDNPLNAVGLLKREMEKLDSLVIAAARRAAASASPRYRRIVSRKCGSLSLSVDSGRERIQLRTSLIAACSARAKVSGA